MNTDHALDQILGALNSTHPPAHMEQRLRARLAAQTSLRPRRRWTAAWLAIPAACALGVAIVATRPHDAAPTATAAIAAPAARGAQPLPAGRAPTHAARARVAHQAAAPAPVDDAFLPSMPAPVQPLTQAERELRHLALPESPTMLAQVEPMREMQRREEAEAAHRRSVDRFAEALLAPLVAGDHLQASAGNSPDTPTQTTTENQ